MGTILDQVSAVRKMQVYIDDHIKEVITLKELADISHYSPWYTSKIFKKYLDKTPFEYIRDRRLSLSALEIRDGQERILDVALDYVFDSHSGFSRAFTKSFGISPTSYRKKSPPIGLFIPFPANDFDYKGEMSMSKEKQVQTIFTQVMDKSERKLLLLRGRKARHYFEYCE